MRTMRASTRASQHARRCASPRAVCAGVARAFNSLLHSRVSCHVVMSVILFPVIFFPRLNACGQVCQSRSQVTLQSATALDRRGGLEGRTNLCTHAYVRVNERSRVRWYMRHARARFVSVPCARPSACAHSWRRTLPSQHPRTPCHRSHGTLYHDSPP